MLITNKNAVTQALANVRLESLTVPPEIIELFDKALEDGSIDTNDILDLLRSDKDGSAVKEFLQQYSKQKSLELALKPFEINLDDFKLDRDCANDR